MTSKDCVAWLTTNEEILEIIDQAYDRESDDGDKGKWHAGVRANAREPSCWKRRTKYKVGSKTDKKGGDIGGGLALHDQPALAGGTVREFWLEGSDGVCFALVEIDGRIAHHVDLCD